MPNDVELKKVPQCTTGRVFVLRVKATGRKLLYWMQVCAVKSFYQSNQIVPRVTVSIKPDCTPSYETFAGSERANLDFVSQNGSTLYSLTGLLLPYQEQKINGVVILMMAN